MVVLRQKTKWIFLVGILSKFGTFYLEFPNATGSIFYRQTQQYPPLTRFKGGLFYSPVRWFIYDC